MSNRSFIKKGTAIKLGEKEVRDRKVMFAKRNPIRLSTTPSSDFFSTPRCPTPITSQSFRWNFCTIIAKLVQGANNFGQLHGDSDWSRGPASCRGGEGRSTGLGRSKGSSHKAAERVQDLAEGKVGYKNKDTGFKIQGLEDDLLQRLNAAGDNILRSLISYFPTLFPNSQRLNVGGEP